MALPRHGRGARVRRQRTLLVLVVVVVLALVLFSRHSPSPTTGSTSSTSTSSTTTQPTTPRAFAIGEMAMTFDEPASATTAARILPVTVRYPVAGAPGSAPSTELAPLTSAGPFPLVIFSQGFDVAPNAYARLLDAWTRAGFVVADPTYPNTSPGAPGGVIRTDIVHHPGDLTYVVSALLAQNANPSAALYHLMNPHAIAVIGHSDGGDVSLATIANSCCRDSRIRAAVILSGAELSWFPGQYFSSPNVPLLVVQGSADNAYNPVACSVQLYNAASEPKYYVDMIGQDHFSAYLPPGPALNEVVRVSVAFLNTYLRHSGTPASILRVGNVTGLSSTTNRTSVPAVAGSCPGAPG